MKENLPLFQAAKKIDYFSEDIDFTIPDSKTSSNWLKSVLKSENRSLDTVSYIFCSDEYLLNINQTYLKHDDLTDIITFPYESEPIEGDIFISIERVTENALHLKIPFENELSRVMVHGLLHLIGFEDKSVEAKLIMTEKENFYLNELLFLK